MALHFFEEKIVIGGNIFILFKYNENECLIFNTRDDYCKKMM